jgi:hypothetical protein
VVSVKIVKNLFARATLTPTSADETKLIPFESIFWETEYREGQELYIKAEYFDGTIGKGKVRYRGMHRNPTPVFPASNEHMVIPLFEAIGPSTLKNGYGRFYWVIDSNDC